MRIYRPYSDASHWCSEEPIVMVLTYNQEGPQHGRDQTAGGVDAITMLLKRKNHDGLGGLFCLKPILPRGETIKGNRYVMAVITSYSSNHFQQLGADRREVDTAGSDTCIPQGFHWILHCKCPYMQARCASK